MSDAMQKSLEVYAVCRADFIANQRCKSFALLRRDANGEAR